MPINWFYEEDKGRIFRLFFQNSWSLGKILREDWKFGITWYKDVWKKLTITNMYGNDTKFLCVFIGLGCQEIHFPFIHNFSYPDSPCLDQVDNYERKVSWKPMFPKNSIWSCLFLQGKYPVASHFIFSGSVFLFSDSKAQTETENSGNQKHTNQGNHRRWFVEWGWWNECQHSCQ